MVIYAQQGFSVKGDVKIHNSFSGNGLFVPQYFAINGVVYTEESTNPNKVIFGKNSSWKQKNNSSFIDGSVRTEIKERFLFPVGNNGKYRPLGLSISENAVVSYKNRKPMNETWVDSTKVKVISPIEYWEVSSVNDSKITLVYDQSISGLRDLDEAAVNRLTIVGFDGYRWIRIPSVIDEYMIDTSSPFLKASTQYSGVVKGSITSTVDVPLIHFSSFALGLTHTENEQIKKELVIPTVNEKPVSQSEKPVKKSTPSIEVQNKVEPTEQKSIPTKEVVLNKNVPSPTEKIALSVNRKEEYVLLKKIHFPFNEKDLSKYSTGVLNSLCENDLLKREKTFRIKLVGHTDIFGSSNYNYTLGLRRAETIKQFLFEKGITNVEVDISSEGEKNANVDCQECKASEMVNLRRVDIYILEK